MTHNSNGEDDGGPWTVVKNRKVSKQEKLQQLVNQSVTFFVSGIPLEVSNADLWSLFQYYGKVVEAFVVKKRNCGNSCFGFVRMIEVTDRIKVEQWLNNSVYWKQKKLNVKLARFDKQKQPFKPNQKVEVNMSADVPLDLQDEIIKRLPVKSLFRFRSVAKRWRALIDSSEFITDYSVNQNHPHHLLIIHCKRSDGEYSKDEYVSIVDDDSFAHRKFSPSVEPISGDLSNSHSFIVGWSHGLVCLYSPDSYTSEIVIWNPSIKKYVSVDFLYGSQSSHGFGFGVCPKTFDIKIVNIISHYKAEVYTLRLGAWRSISMNLARKPQYFPNDVVVIDGVIHWRVHEWVAKNGTQSFDQIDRWIVSFDLKTEEFREVYLPDSLAGSRSMDISKRNESLVILDYSRSPECDVWMMYENGVSSSSFIKLFTVDAYPYSIIGFRKNGQVILKRWRDGCCPPELHAYDPVSKHMNCIGTFNAVIQLASYTESLLLLNHSTSTIIQ